LALSVPKNMPSEKMPHIMKYAANEAGEEPANPVNFGRTRSATRLHQNRP
jgi:hypothetical protein